MQKPNPYTIDFPAQKRSVSRNDIYVLHHDDLDGYMSAGIVDRFMSTSTTPCKFIAVQYGQSFPSNVPLNKSTHILIVDFSYKREILEDVRSRVASLVVIDHHKTAQKDLEDLPYAFYNMDECGASLTWAFLSAKYEFEKDSCYTDNGTTAICKRSIHPALVYTRDWDLWKFENPKTKHFEAACRTHPRHKDVHFYSDILKEEDSTSVMIEPFDFDQFMEKGRTVFEYEEQKIKAFVNSRKYEVFDFNKFLYECFTCSYHTSTKNELSPKPLSDDLKQWLEIYPFFKDECSFKSMIPQAHNVAVYNCVDQISATATAVYKGNYVVNFVMSFFGNVKKQQTIFSLRSPEGSDVDVSLISSCFGGGGHKGAAGFPADNKLAAVLLEHLVDGDISDYTDTVDDYSEAVFKLGVMFTYIFLFKPMGLTQREHKEQLVSMACEFYKHNERIEDYNAFRSSINIDRMREMLDTYLELIGFYLPSFPEKLMKTE